jgi:hypothetical protein
MNDVSPFRANLRFFQIDVAGSPEKLKQFLYFITDLLLFRIQQNWNQISSSIQDRLVHNADKVELKGETMSKKRTVLTNHRN